MAVPGPSTTTGAAGGGGWSKPTQPIQLFNQSSQYRNWRYSRSGLQKIRKELNIKAVNRVRANVEKERAEHTSLEKATSSEPTPPPPTEIQYLTSADELALVTYYLTQISALCAAFKYPESVQSTAMSYLKRFYVGNTCMDYHPKNVMLTSVFLSTKIENYPISLEQFATKTKSTPAEILALEFLISQSLRFEYKVHHAGLAASGLLLDFQTTNTPPWEIESTYTLVQPLLKLSRLTDLEFIYSPSQIALAAFYLISPSLVLSWLALKASFRDSEEEENERLIEVLKEIGVELERAKEEKVDKEMVKDVDRRLKWARNPEKVEGSALYVFHRYRCFETLYSTSSEYQHSQSRKINVTSSMKRGFLCSSSSSSSRPAQPPAPPQSNWVHHIISEEPSIIRFSLTSSSPQEKETCYALYLSHSDSVIVDFNLPNLNRIACSSSSSFTSCETHNGTYKVVDIKNKGLGMVANRRIKAGETICLDAPLFAIPPSSDLDPQLLHTIFSRLSTSSQLKLLALFHPPSLPHKIVSSILATNSFRVQIFLPSSYYSVLYPLLSRINHSCNPSSIVEVDQLSKGRAIAVALRNIEPEEEITISYIDASLPHSERQEWLEEGPWYFTCTCQICSAAPQNRLLSDGKRSLIKKIRNFISRESEYLSSGNTYRHDASILEPIIESAVKATKSEPLLEAENLMEVLVGAVVLDREGKESRWMKQAEEGVERAWKRGWKEEAEKASRVLQRVVGPFYENVKWRSWLKIRSVTTIRYCRCRKVIKWPVALAKSFSTLHQQQWRREKEHHK